MGLFGPFVYKNKNKERYYLHMRERGKGIIYFFTKDPVGAIFDLPPGYEVGENPKTGMPFLRKKQGGGFLSFLFPSPKEAKGAQSGTQSQEEAPQEESAQGETTQEGNKEEGGEPESGESEEEE